MNIAAATTQLPELWVYTTTGFILTGFVLVVVAVTTMCALEGRPSRRRAYVTRAAVVFLLVAALITLACVVVYAAQWTDYRRSLR